MQWLGEARGRGQQLFDIIIVGGGPAGLSAALVAGRALRRVLLLDEGKPRNQVTRAVHGFFTRDGTPPEELRRLGREQLGRYETVSLLAERVQHANAHADHFEVITSRGAKFAARKLILATGLVDELPAIPGMRELFGRLVFNCPYCDAFELRDRPLAAYGQGDQRGGEYALELTAWSRDVALCTDACPPLSHAMRERLARNGVSIRDEAIQRIESQDGGLTRVVFERGPPLVCAALFVNTGHREASDLARTLGAEGWSPENCRVGKHGRTNVRGLFVVGDASRDVLQVAVAVSEGCEAAMSAHAELLREERA
jgi:thioredoxin reductase